MKGRCIFHAAQTQAGVAPIAAVAQTSSLMYRGFAICKRRELPTPQVSRTSSRLEVGDIAGWKPALRAWAAHQWRTRFTALAGVAALAFLLAGCGRKDDESQASGHAGTNEPSSAASNAPAPGDMKMSGGQMPTGEPASHTASTNRLVPGRGPVDLDKAQRQLINIRTRAVTRGDAVVTIRTVGIVAYDQTRLANVNTRIMGWAQKLYVDKPGQYVEKGAPLMGIYSPDLYSAQYEYLLAYRHCERLKHIVSTDRAATNAVARSTSMQESVTEAETLRDSARKRLKLWEISDEEISALEKSGKPSDTLQLPSPVSGYVIDKNIDPAQMVRPGMTLYRVADLSSVWINVEIYEYELPYVKVGQKVQVTASAHPGHVYNAAVDFIYPYSENKTRTTTVRLVMDNPDGLFKPNDYVNAEIKVDRGRRLLVPSTAVYDTGVSQYVFVEVTEGHFVPRRVELGPTVGDQVVVKEGLAEGEKIVVDGNFLLDSESQLQAAGRGG